MKSIPSMQDEVTGECHRCTNSNTYYFKFIGNIPALYITFTAGQIILYDKQIDYYNLMNATLRIDAKFKIQT